MLCLATESSEMERREIMRYLICILAVLIAIPPAESSESGVILGVVRDSVTKKPLEYAIVAIVGDTMGSMTLSDGSYLIANVPVGAYHLKARKMGYKSLEKRGVLVALGDTTVVDFELEMSLMGETGEIVVKADRKQIDVTASKMSHGKQPGIAMGRRRPPVRHSFCRPSDYFNTEEYAYVAENRIFETIMEPLSTFSIDVDVASYSNARRFINGNRLPVTGAVRIEEFINYFDYDYDRPSGDAPFSINLEYSECPWDDGKRLVHIGLQGAELAEEDAGPSNLVFLIDISGSMRPSNKLPLLRKAFQLMIRHLRDEDRVSLVVYSSSARVVLEYVPGSKREKIKRAIMCLMAEGRTAGGEGMRLAYRLAEDGFIRGGNNRVIMATDGDFNVGVSSTSELLRFIEKKREKGIYLTVLGFGVDNYKDNRLEQLADKGNGNHAYIDNILEAKKVFVMDIMSTLYTIAKDVKIQVEFNPARISSYRLIGYENRLLDNQDFSDDTKDAGEIGAGHSVTALYEVTPAAEGTEVPKIYELRYQEIMLKKSAGRSDESLIVRVRYKEPGSGRSKLIVKALKGEPVDLADSSENFRFAAAAAMYAMILRDSGCMGKYTFDDVIELAGTARGKDRFGYRAEFIQLVERAELLTLLE